MTAKVFVKSISRAGGSLLTTMLDCHSKLAMSYEVSPHLYQVDREKFFAYALRSGVTRKWLEEALHGVENPWKAVEIVGEAKARNENKPFWGARMQGSYREYLNHFPYAKFIYVIRDGFDVLASQMNTGAFNPDPRELGRKHLNSFFQFLEELKVRPLKFHVVSYERLVTNVVHIANMVCDFLGLEYEDKMTKPYQQDLTVFRSNHITRAKLMKPINADSIGRWVKDLSAQDAVAFTRGQHDSITNRA